MGGGTSKESCKNAGYYREAINVGQEDTGMKIFDFHGSGVLTFLLGILLGAFLSAAFILSCRRLGINCRRKSTHKEAAEVPFTNDRAEMQLFQAPPAISFLQQDHPIVLATPRHPHQSSFYQSPPRFEDITPDHPTNYHHFNGQPSPGTQHSNNRRDNVPKTRGGNVRHANTVMA